MNVSIAILDGALPREVPPYPADMEVGAVVTFEGVVRQTEDGRTIEALHYDTYEPMAQNMLQAIAQDLADAHGLIIIDIMHSRGRVAVGDCSFRLIIAARHRPEALAATEMFIERMKRDVPIWKRPLWAGSSIA